MARYVKPSEIGGWYDDDAPLLPSLNVDEHKPVKTGLLWPNGEPVMRMPRPIGFGRDSEW